MAYIKTSKRPSLHIDSISCGFGGPSMAMVYLAARGKIKGTHVFCSDTGSENDCLWNTGERTTARVYFDRIVEPFCHEHGLKAYFTRAVDERGDPLPPLWDHFKAAVDEGVLVKLHMPLFGSEGGRLMQTCTDRWKITGIKQQARRLGATSLLSAQGIHKDEYDRRASGIWLDAEIYKGRTFDLYQTVARTPKGKPPILVHWMKHFYPLTDLGLGREHVEELLAKIQLPYIKWSQCDMCPHQDLKRWEARSLPVLQEIATYEARMGGQYFFSDERVPLMEALEIKRQKEAAKPGTADVGCGNSYCFT